MTSCPLDKNAYSTGEMEVAKQHHEDGRKRKPLDFSRGFDVKLEWSCGGSLHCSHFFLKQVIQSFSHRMEIIPEMRHVHIGISTGDGETGC